MGLVIIAGLLFLVCRAANQLNAAEKAAAATSQQQLPSPSPVTTGAASSAPSPATAMGAPGAFNGYAVILDTNGQFPQDAAGYYSITDVPPGMNGIPLEFVPGGAWNGYNPSPSTDKSLSTQTKPPRSNMGFNGYPTQPVFKL